MRWTLAPFLQTEKFIRPLSAHTKTKMVAVSFFAVIAFSLRLLSPRFVFFCFVLVYLLLLPTTKTLKTVATPFIRVSVQFVWPVCACNCLCAFVSVSIFDVCRFYRLSLHSYAANELCRFISDRTTKWLWPELLSLASDFRNFPAQSVN